MLKQTMSQVCMVGVPVRLSTESKTGYAAAALGGSSSRRRSNRSKVDDEDKGKALKSLGLAR